MEHNKKIEGAKEAIMLIDEWRNSSAICKYVATSLKFSIQTIFLMSYDISETGEFLEKYATRAREHAKEKYDLDVNALVSDSARNMMKMARQIPMYHSRCQAHDTNLLIADISDALLYKPVLAKFITVFETSKR